MDIFETCQTINDNLRTDNQVLARNGLIQLLDFHFHNKIQYSELVNHLIRETGLYPYLQPASSSWQDRFAYDAFKVNVGKKTATLHREQSYLLKRLLDGENIAVSAPTSFGKSFIIDAFISIKKPVNVVIIVPTIALTDETRRRLFKKFSDEYKIITTSDVVLADKNIFIFPQERAINYVNTIETIDILIVDEFYKASSFFDEERAPALLRAIIKLGEKAKQKYFLAPNISEIVDNVFTKGMVFLEMLDCHTVYLEKHELYREIGKNDEKKSRFLLDILGNTSSKTLIYAGTYSEIDRVSNLLIEHLPILEKPLLTHFADWLGKNYDVNWNLINLTRRGAGIHNGRLHRSLSQIQIKLFEESRGLDKIISTSSIIEGVNTSAENIIIWRNRNGSSKLNDFTYKNIIGRGGRMFKHFIGQIYLLESPPETEATQLEIPFPDIILGGIDEVSDSDKLSKEQISKIISFKEEMNDLLGEDSFKTLVKENSFQISDFDFIKGIANDMKAKPSEWNGLSYLNSDNVNNWDRLLYRIIVLQPGNWDTQYSKFVAFIKTLSENWTKTIPELLDELSEYDIGINEFFTLERNVSFKFASLANDVNELQKIILHNNQDISSFVSKLSHVFLPSVVYQLEEYCLPRMLSKKLHYYGVIDFFEEGLTLHQSIEILNKTGLNKILDEKFLEPFEKYILKYFYDGITLESV